MFTMETAEFLTLLILTVLRLGVPILLFLLLTTLARRVQTLQP